MPTQFDPSDGSHEFGGDWTDLKLDLIENYLRAYVKVLQRKRLSTAFIDAFAGTGYRTTKSDRQLDEPERALPFPDLAEPAPQRLLAGSARRALRVRPPFEKYIFIERDGARCASLESLKVEFPELANRILVRQGDANEEIQKLCLRDWSRHRAVLFLDPYGMQVKWATVEAVAKTKAIDLWLLVPLGIGVNRLLKRSGDIPEPWRKALDEFLGTRDWFDSFYTSESSPSLFGDEDARLVKAGTSAIGHYFNERLRSVFAAVADSPAVLRNSTNSPLYLLCFAVGNTAAKDVALRIANHLLKRMR